MDGFRMPRYVSKEGLKKVVAAIKNGNPLDGMTREEWNKEIVRALREAAWEFGETGRGET